MRSEKGVSQFIEERKKEKRNKLCFFHLPYVYDRLVKTLHTVQKTNQNSLCLNPPSKTPTTISFLFRESFMYPR